MNRKDDHLQAVLAMPSQSLNGFDRMKVFHNSLMTTNPNEIDLSTTLSEIQLEVPFFINAMTGGSQKAKEMNRALAKLAKTCHLAMATGSMNTVFNDRRSLDSFTVIREENPDGVLFVNVNANVTLSQAQQVIEWMNPTALQIHLNPIQELVMPEGDRQFEHRIEHIRALKQLSVPLMVKEVGFGLNRQALNMLQELDILIVDVAGKGGTNFASVENARRQRKREVFEQLGITTLDCLLELKQSRYQGDVISSGGILNALDMIKSFMLGAKAVGMSRYFLDLVTTLPFEKQVEAVEDLKQDLIDLMAIFNAKTVSDLQKCDYQIKE